MSQKIKTDILFCIPGNSFSSRVFSLWLAAEQFFSSQGISILLINKYSSNIYFARNMLLGGDVTRGKDQKPYNSDVEYKYLMWVDSDILFNFDTILTLMKHDKDIVSGWCRLNVKDMAISCGRFANDGFLKTNIDVNVFTPAILEEEAKKSTLVEVDYVGFSFVMVKYGIFETLDYPWFKPLFFDVGYAADQITEDLSWCYQVRKKDYKILVDSSCRVFQEKEFNL